MTDTHNESAGTRKARAKGQALVAQMRDAAKHGRLKVGVRDIEPTTEEAFDDLELAAQQYEKSRARGETTVPITIRMDPHMIDELRVMADRLGVRGYQTLIKQWIGFLITNETLINVKHLADMPLGKVVSVIESAKVYGGIGEVREVKTLDAIARLTSNTPGAAAQRKRSKA
jgi:hypothetical protein